MARVTVEDCVEQIPNRFELVLVAAQRTREIAHGADIMVDRDRDKNTVVALREIAGCLVNKEALQEGLIQRHQKLNTADEVQMREVDMPEEEYIDEEQLLAQLRSEMKDSRIFEASSDEDGDDLSDDMIDEEDEE